MVRTPGPGSYQDTKLRFNVRSPSVNFDQSPKWGKGVDKSPGPACYNVNEKVIQPFSKSMTFNKQSRNYNKLNHHLSAMNPGPGQYDNSSYKLKSTQLGISIPKSKNTDKMNKNPGPGCYRPNVQAVKGKTPSARIVMDEVDRLVQRMNQTQLAFAKQ